MIDSASARTRLAISARGRLAERLRTLRTTAWPGVTVTQRQLADALGASAPLVSSWENTGTDTVPPEERLHSYAQFFATVRSLDGHRARLLPHDQLTADEEQRRVVLLEELLELRAAAMSAQRVAERSRSFWHFPDGQPIRIISSILPPHEINSQYTSPWHPNHIASLRHADMDALVEAYGQIRADNPTSDVAFVRGDEVTAETFAAHVVILGGGDDVRGDDPRGARPYSEALAYYRRRLDLPVFVETVDGGDPEYDRQYVVTSNDAGEFDYHGRRREAHPPRFLLDGLTGEHRRSLDGHPMLEYDVALIARLPNEMNLTTTVTICSGIFSRGTYGAVRAFTDPLMRVRNEEYLSALVDPERFWLLSYVPVFQGRDGLETLTPDLTRPMHVLRHSPSPG
ncbi:MAG: helix-turn-helix domain-containing protein [Kineosporiaceae bacterium]|nr:helix-turn-helix domain-containing protein [Kineosporiaceae bacterium]